jgi:hypothetical protein
MLYTDDEGLLTPTVAETPDAVEFGKLGVYKASAWAFEREWRFRLFAVPHPFPDDGDFANPRYADSASRGVWEVFRSRRVPDSHLFCSLTDAAFRGMALLLGPCVGAERRKIVEQAVRQWNPACVLSESRHTGQIRCS